MQYRIQIITTLFVLLLLFAVAPSDAWAQGSLEPRGDRSAPSSSIDTDRDQDEKYSNSDVRRLVEREFGDNHVMVEVARCESSFRQFSGDNVLVNSIGATGIFQILQRVHEEIAEDFGYDIYTVKGNIGYAKALYEADGLKPWSASSLCWDDGNIAGANPEVSSNQLYLNNDSSSGKLQRRVEERRAELVREGEVVDTSRYQEVISRRLIIGVDTAEVLTLQKLLNRIGYRLAASGPGSPGEETSFFGSLTKQAIEKFQCDQGIICSGSEYTTGYGMTEERTRAALNKAAATGITSGRVQQRGDIDTKNKRTSSNSDLQAQITELKIQLAQLQVQLGQ